MNYFPQHTIALPGGHQLYGLPGGQAGLYFSRFSRQPNSSSISL